MTTKVYVVGDANAPKTNQWEHMTNSRVEADRLAEELGKVIEGITCIKEVTVPPSRRGKR